jgi:hypothetical protein
MTMISGDQNYLCTKDGKVVGPFSKAELGEMKKSGAIHAYFWVWEAENPQWLPAVAPPPGPPESGEITNPALMVRQTRPEETERYAKFDTGFEATNSEHYVPAFTFDDEEEEKELKPPSRPAKKRGHGHDRQVDESRRMTVVAHDHRNVVSGWLKQYTPYGATVLGWAPRDRGIGPFVKGNKIMINVLDTRTGKSESVEAHVDATLRRGDTWEFRVRWDHAPELLAA